MVPSAFVTRAMIDVFDPSFAGLMSTVTVSPALSMFRDHPARPRTPGARPSQAAHSNPPPRTIQSGNAWLIPPGVEHRLVGEDGAIRLRHPRNDRRLRPVFRRAHVNSHRLARFEYVSRPSGAAEDAGSSSLALPLHLPALPIVHDHVQPGVRVHPLEALDDAGDGDHLGDLVGDVAVMRHRWRGKKKTGEHDGDDCGPHFARPANPWAIIGIE